MSAARGVAVLLMALALNALEGAKGNEVDYPAKWWKTANCYADSGELLVGSPMQISF